MGKDVIFDIIKVTFRRLYLGIILGPVDVSFTSKQDKFEYKNNYENFKITVSAIISLYALFLYFFNQYRQVFIYWKLTILLISAIDYKIRICFFCLTGFE